MNIPTTKINTNKLKIINNDTINIDKRILPLFSKPLISKKLQEKIRNKYNFNIINQEQILKDKIFSLNKILELLLKGINIYTHNLNNYLKNHNKLELILNIKNDKYYQLNLNISNYFYMVNTYIPVFKLRSLLYNVRLFLPKQLLKPVSYIKFNYRLRKISKIYLEHLIYDNKNINSRKININKLLDKGHDIINEINNQINIKKILINKLQIIISNKLDKKISPLNINTKNTIQIHQTTNIIKKEKIKNNKILLDEKKLFINTLFNSLYKTNEIKIKKTLSSILNFNTFDYKKDTISIHSNPVEILYYNKNNGSKNIDKKPIINQYLKSLSIYNMKNNGILMSYSNITSFNFINDTNKLIKNIYKLLASSFKSMYCLISKPVFVMTPDKIIIQLFYFLLIPNILKLKKIQKYRNYKKLSKILWFKRKKKIKKRYRKFRNIKKNIRIILRKLSNIVLTKIFTNRFKKLCNLLSQLFKKPVHLDLIRIHYPYYDNNILVNLIGIMINKIRIRLIVKRMFNKIKIFNKLTGKNKINIIPAYLAGINVRVAGKLLTQKSIPRQTVKIYRKGATATSKINLSDVARYTNKNKKGAFSITVSSGQNLY